MSSIKFPNESEAYRSARAELLQAEADLRDQTERVAVMRRELPLGGELPEDYVFDELQGGKVSQVTLSSLFGDKDTLFLYGFMFHPDKERPCPLCTSILDAMNGSAEHLRQTIEVAVVSRSSIDRVQGCADRRGWSNLRMLSSAGCSYHADYLCETPSGAQVPMGNVFVKREGKIHHTWGTELFYGPPNQNGDARHFDIAWPLWNILDFTPGGRGQFYPQLSY